MDLFPSCNIELIIIVLIMALPGRSYSDKDKYTICGQLFDCGNLQNIGYPFWGDTRPDYCGHPSFGLTDCQTNKPIVITMSWLAYRILSFNTPTRSLTLVRDDYWGGMCPPYLRNTTLDEAKFRYENGTTDLLLYYGCEVLGTVTPPNQFTCLRNSSHHQVFYALGGVALNEGVYCQTSVSVRVEVPSGATETYNATQVVLDGFGVIWDADDRVCDKCIRDGGRCGSNSISGSFVCYTKNESIGAMFRPFRIGFLLVFALGTMTILIVALCCLRRIIRRSIRSLISSMKRPGNENVEAFIRIHGSLAPKRYTYLNIKKITNSFNDKLGQGGFGAVFKGKLPDGRQVAVKVLKETKAEGEDFFNEVASIGRTSHVNVVTLLGFCFESRKRALIYEYMVGGSLDKAIHEKLAWTTLYQIAIGVARGLEYLHRGCNMRIVHFDIKPHNILLDQKFHPKISDFGLAKLCHSRQSIISMSGARGTAGYIAPEVFSRAFGRVSHKSDVYSYGMLLIEMTGVDKNKIEEVQTSVVYFPDWVYKHLEQDTELEFCGATDKDDKEIAKKMLLVGLWCIQTNPLDRPPMSKVVDMLENDLESLQVPPKPLLLAPLRTCLSSGNSSDELSSINIELQRLETEVQSSK